MIVKNGKQLTQSQESDSNRNNIQFKTKQKNFIALQKSDENLNKSTNIILSKYSQPHQLQQQQDQKLKIKKYEVKL